jgi:hypothetical protein
MISQRRDVLAIVIGLLLTVSVALGIVVLVALPNLRHGSRILTPDGERAVKRAKQQAKQKPLAAAGSTWHGLVALERQLARLGRQAGRVWAPISEALHGALDRMEDRDSAKGTAASADSDTPDVGKAGAMIRHLAGPAGATPAAQASGSAAEPEAAPRQARFDVAPVTGGSSVGRPRKMPPISGPIPEITEEQKAQESAESGGRTIDLRGTERSEAGEEVDQDAGGARRAR